jgi:hypothetical protein
MSLMGFSIAELVDVEEDDQLRLRMFLYFARIDDVSCSVQNLVVGGLQL